MIVLFIFFYSISCFWHTFNPAVRFQSFFCSNFQATQCSVEKFPCQWLKSSKPFQLVMELFKLFSFWTSWRLICIVLLLFRYPPFIGQSNRQKQQMIMAVSHQTIYILLKRNMYMLTRCSCDSSVSNDKRQYFFVQGEFSFYEKTWKEISLSAKQLISDLLKVDPEKRPSAQEVWD